MKVKFLRGGLLIAAVALILIGLGRDGFQDVKHKAVRICYECIGIG
ncbi:MAG: hypothetical protein NC300_10270 [Bacteroidales bacterium]|nr:hypothetical protein [Clostridium sp.]MCM1204515.1 hypothetical protein [Bacteroidales bacterium]